MNDPNQMLWHNSMVSTLAACEQKFAYAYLEGLDTEPKATDWRLVLGSWFHGLMAAQGLKQGLAQGTLLEVPAAVNLGHDDLKYAPTEGLTPASAHQMWIEEVHAYVPEGVDENWDALPDTVWFLYERYIAAHKERLVSEEVLLVEHQWSRTEPNSGMVWGGRVDRVVRDRSTGRVIVRDHKTTSSVPDADQRLLNSQLHLYAWGLAPTLAGHDLEVAAVEYDWVYTGGASTVRLTKAGNLYANQGLLDPYALAVLLDRAVDEWNAEQVEKAGEGEEPEVLTVMDERFDKERARAEEEGIDQFFRRSLMPINVTVVRNLLAQGVMARNAATDIVAVSSDTDQPLGAMRNVGRHCGWCSFAEVCVGDLYGNDTSLLRENFIARDVETVEDVI